MSVNPFEEPFEAAVSPVQVNPFGDAEAQNHIILLSLSEQEVIVLQDIIGLKGEEEMDVRRNMDYEPEVHVDAVQREILFLVIEAVLVMV